MKNDTYLIPENIKEKLSMFLPRPLMAELWKCSLSTVDRIQEEFSVEKQYYVLDGQNQECCGFRVEDVLKVCNAKNIKWPEDVQGFVSEDIVYPFSKRHSKKAETLTNTLDQSTFEKALKTIAEKVFEKLHAQVKPQTTIKEVAGVMIGCAIPLYICAGSFLWFESSNNDEFKENALIEITRIHEKHILDLKSFHATSMTKKQSQLDQAKNKITEQWETIKDQAEVVATMLKENQPLPEIIQEVEG